MNYIGIVSHTLAILAFSVLLILLLVNWRGRLTGAGLLVATVGSIVWLVSTIYTYLNPDLVKYQFIIELIRDYLWLYFLIFILKFILEEDLLKKYKFSTTLLYAIFLFFFLLLVPEEDSSKYVFSGWPNLVYLLSAILGIFLIEQIYKNTSASNKWAIKHLCIGLVVLFSYDLVIYSYSYLFKDIPSGLWDARGIINAMAVPLIAVSAARNPNWSPIIAVSRKVVFYSATFTIVGIYLLIMAGIGVYIKQYGGEWGELFQLIFLYTVAIILAVLILSGSARAKLKIFVSENFYNYKFDYREEWLRLMRIMSTPDEGMTLYQKLIKSVAQIVESPGGVLWLRRDKEFVPVEGWNSRIPVGFVEPEDGDFIKNMEASQVVIDLHEMLKMEESETCIAQPRWIMELKDAWLAIPIIMNDSLCAFIVLVRSKVDYKQSWEDSELLRTVGQQVASYLAQHEAANKLAEVQQFEAFNRLSAFVVHDLNNLVAQLDLIVSNAHKHIDNPEFVRDAIQTVDSAVKKMNRLLNQLKQGAGGNEVGKERVELYTELYNIVTSKNGRMPVPKFTADKNNMEILAKRDDFISIINHLINNAQDATDDDGEIEIKLYSKQDKAIVEIRDTGCGMTDDFVNNRLFKPFDTTKGNAGMGIGVFECREFMRHCSGQIHVKSKVGKGTTFTLEFPLLKTRESIEGYAQ